MTFKKLPDVLTKYATARAVGSMEARAARRQNDKAAIPGARSQSPRGIKRSGNLGAVRHGVGGVSRRPG